nr:MAG TPA: hypothetical protein [Crassvirales sp.]
MGTIIRLSVGRSSLINIVVQFDKENGKASHKTAKKQ